MKITLHIPVEQYGFVAVEGDDSAVVPDVVVEQYRAISDAFKPKPVNEMPRADFQAILDDFLDDHSIAGDPGELEKMSPVQRQIINEIKKGYKRLQK